MSIKIIAWRQCIWQPALLLAACAGDSGPVSRPLDGSKNSAADAPAAAERGVVLFVGTSLTAGYGLAPSQAFPARVQSRIDSAGLPFRVVNAGVSGETSAGAVRRIDWLLGQGPIAVLVIETGANDGLRGQSPDSLRANLRRMLERARALAPAPHLIVAGMEALPNLGRVYAGQFRAIYPAVAREFDATYLPFLLDGVAGVDALNQADGVHPTAKGAERVAEHVWKTLRPVLTQLASQPENR